MQDISKTVPSYSIEFERKTDYDELLLQFNRIRRTAYYQHNKANIELGDLIKLCELFNCEVGYLLCEYDTPYRVQSDISEQTQLSTKAIENIMKSRDNHKKLFGNCKNSLDVLLSSDDFIKMLERVEEYRILKSSNVDKNMIDAKAFALYKDFINIIDNM